MALHIDSTGLELEAGPFWMSLSFTLLAFSWASGSGLCIAYVGDSHRTQLGHPAPPPAPAIEAWREDSIGCRYVRLFGLVEVCLQRQAWRPPLAA